MGLFDKILLNIIKGRAKNTLKLIQDDLVLKKGPRILKND